MVNSNHMNKFVSQGHLLRPVRREREIEIELFGHSERRMAEAIASLSLSKRDTGGSRRSGSTSRTTPINSHTFSETDPFLTSSSAPLTYSRNNEDPETTPPHTATPVYQSARRGVGYQRCCYDRIPKGKALLLVLFLDMVQMFAFYSAINGALSLVFEKQGTLLGFIVSLLLQLSAGRLVYPVAGFIADVYLGRYKVIHIGLWILLIAHCILAMTLALSLNGYTIVIEARYALGVLAYVLISAGSASIETNIIPFGVDQLSQGPSSVEMSSYFYWYYFGRQLGALAGVFISPVLIAVLEAFHFTGSSFFGKALSSVTVVLMLAIAIMFHYHLKKWYFKDTARPNALKLVVKVIWYAAIAKRQFPRYRRAFRYGEGWKPRIELAKIDYDGIYERKDVEDVKSICQIVLLQFSLGGYWVTYAGVSSIDFL